MNETIFKAAAEVILRAGAFPLPVNDTLLTLLETIMTEEQARFITVFTGPKNFDELSRETGMDRDVLKTVLDGLMNDGIITGILNRKGTEMIYRVLPVIPGMFEFTLMRGEKGPKQKKLAELFDRIFGELAGMVQDNYDAILPAFKHIPPMTRVIPLNVRFDPSFEAVMPLEDVTKVVERFDTIAVAHCYCRHEKDLLGKPCQVTDERKNCLFFGRTARFVIDHKFGEAISRDKALAILKKAGEDGLVHKAFHESSDTAKDEMAICNCCKCCCETFRLFYRGSAPSVTYASHVAGVTTGECTACGICTDMCPMEAVIMDDSSARVDSDRCIGCGVCVLHCPAGAMELERTGQRTVYVPPPRLTL
jgi:ferredoxin